MKCSNSECINFDIEIAIDGWAGSKVICGPCGETIVEEDPNFQSPEPVPTRVERVLETLGTFTDEEWDELRDATRQNS